MAAGLQAQDARNATQLPFGSAQPASSDPFAQGSTLLAPPPGPAGPKGPSLASLSMGGVSSGPNPSLGAAGLQPASLLVPAGPASGWSFLDDLGVPPSSATASGGPRPPGGASGNAGYARVATPPTGGVASSGLTSMSGALGGVQAGGGLPSMGTVHAPLPTVHVPSLAKGTGSLGNAGFPAPAGGLSGQVSGSAPGVLDPFDFGSMVQAAPASGGPAGAGPPGASGSQFDPFDFGPMQKSTQSRTDSLI